MFVTIAIFILGLLYWICYVHTVVFYECMFPDEHWFTAESGDLSLYASLSLAFTLLFIWNLAIFLGFRDAETKKQKKVTRTFFLANTIAILLVGFTLFHFYHFINDYRTIHYQKIEGTYDYEGWYSGENICGSREPYLGQWNILQQSQESLSSSGYLEFHRDGTITSEKEDLFGNHWNGVNSFVLPPNRELIPYEVNSDKTNLSTGLIDQLVCFRDNCFWESFYWYSELKDSRLLLMKLNHDMLLSGDYMVLERGDPTIQP